MEGKKIEIETDQNEKNEKSKVKTDASLKAKTKNTQQQKVKSSNKHANTNDSKMFAIYEKRKMIEPLRKELLMRGWTEKLIEDSSGLPEFVWLSRSNGVVIQGSPIVNRLKQKSIKNFCYKDVLINYGREVNKKSELNIPRTFKLFANERNEFMDDYRLTAYSSFIRYLKESGSNAFSEAGKIKASWIKFAIEKLEAAIVSDDYKQSDNKGFDKFKNSYQSVVRFKSKIKANRATTKHLLQQCHDIYKKCKEAWKDFDKDGFYNLWLLKPARRSLGVGIKLFDDDVDILSYADTNASMMYLAQKYVGEFVMT